MNVMHTQGVCINYTQNLFRIICVSIILTMKVPDDGYARK